MGETMISSYEELPYSRHPFATSHPDCLSAVAALYGLDAAPVTGCRVLELGCASGGNLIPMAATLPDSRFVGIDLAPNQIEEGQAIVRALGLGNIDLRAMSITDVGRDFGAFDYVICHGVYSWVPAFVQEKILAVCAANLAPRGVAYVSYNTFPGWHQRGVVREMLNFHVRRFDAPQDRVQQARGFLDFLVQAVRGPNTVFAQIIKQEADKLAPVSDTYLFHEHLEDINSPCYVHEFAARADRHGLQYLAEAEPSVLAADIPPAVNDVLDRLAPDRVTREQYLDFLTNRTFRRTLLCHGTVTLQPAPIAAAVMTLRVTTKVKPVRAKPDVHGDAAEEFVSQGGGVTLASSRPLVKCALMTLFEAFPRSLPFDVLWESVRQRLPEGSVEPEPHSLAEALLRLYHSHVVELRQHEPSFVLEPGRCPKASPLARLQAELDASVTNLRHYLVDLDDFDRLLLRHLDGTRDKAALLAALTAAVVADELEIQHEGQPLRDPERIQAVLNAALPRSMHRLAASTLLVG